MRREPAPRRESRAPTPPPSAQRLPLAHAPHTITAPTLAADVVNKLEGNTAGFGAVLALFVTAGQPQMADIALNENVRTVGNWLANNVDPAIAKTRSEAQDLPAWYAAVEPPP